MSTAEPRHRRAARAAADRDDRALGRDPLPQRGRVDRARASSKARETMERDGHQRRGRRRRQRLRPTARPSSPRRPAPGSSTSRARATAPPTWPASTPRAGKYILMGDADDTYDFTRDRRASSSALEDGADLVMGNRMGGSSRGAMPWLHRYVGNPMLTGILNLFFRTGVSRRPLRHARLPPRPAAAARPAHHRHGVRLRARDPRVASSSSTSARSPIEYHPRKGESKLSSFCDGWRHLRFLLVHSPTWLFLSRASRCSCSALLDARDRAHRGSTCSVASGTSTR